MSGREHWQNLRRISLEHVAERLGYRRDPRDRNRWKRQDSVINISGAKFFDHLQGRRRRHRSHHPWHGMQLRRGRRLADRTACPDYCRNPESRAEGTLAATSGLPRKLATGPGMADRCARPRTPRPRQRSWRREALRRCVGKRRVPLHQRRRYRHRRGDHRTPLPGHGTRFPQKHGRCPLPGPGYSAPRQHPHHRERHRRALGTHHQGRRAGIDLRLNRRRLPKPARLAPGPPASTNPVRLRQR